MPSSPPGPLPPRLSSILGRLLAQELRGKSPSWDEGLVQALHDRRGPVYFCLRVEGRKAWERWTAQADQWTALREGIQQLRSQVSSAALTAATTMELCLAYHRKVIDPHQEADWKNLLANTSRGVYGLEFASGDARELISPTSVVASNASVERLLQRFTARHGIPVELIPVRVKVGLLASDQLLVRLDREGETVILTRGSQLVSPARVDGGIVDELVELLGRFLARSVRAEGRMAYLYYPSREEEDTASNNMIRQWMASLALCRLAAARSDSRLFELADRNIQYNLDRFYRREGDFGLVEFEGKVKLGALALAALTLRSHPERSRYRPIEDRLRRTIDHLWQPSGEFRTFWQPADRNDMQDFYPGEALLAWASWYREEKDPALLQRFMRSFRHYRAWHLEPQHRRPAFVPWHTQACASMYRETGDPELRAFVFEMNDWLVQFQQWPADEHPEFAGRFYPSDPAFGPPHASSTGVFLEGLVEACELALTHGDARRSEVYRLAVSRGLRSVAQLTFRDDVEMFYAQRRERLRGGVRTATYDNVIRIDNVQHALMALLRAKEVFHPRDFSCSSYDWPVEPSEELPADGAVQWVRGDVLEGANAYADQTVVCATLRCLPELVLPDDVLGRVSYWLPWFSPETAAIAESASASPPLRTARLIAAIAQQLQAHVRCSAEFASAADSAEPDGVIAVTGTAYPEVGLRALGLATLLVVETQLADPDPERLPFARHWGAFERFAQSFLPGPMRREMARVARARGVPCDRMSRGPDILRFGTGRWQQRCDLTTTTQTSMVHAHMTSNKPVSNPILRRMGVPVPRQVLATSADAAVAAAKTIGYPVVVKPWSGSGGYGVSANLVSESQVRQAYGRAARLRGAKVAVEEFLPGDDYRLLFIGGEYVAACRRNPPHVVGDGRSSVTELVHATNLNRDRSDGFWNTLHEYQIDKETIRVLEASGLRPDSVPVAGEKVTLSSAANGGTTTDTTAIMHPDNVAAAARAARVAGIDVCGVDFLLPDPAQSYQETGGGICEVNYQPSPMVHIIADGGRSLDVLERFIDFLVPGPRCGRVPVGVLFEAPAEAGPWLGRLLGSGVARSSDSGVWFDDHRVTSEPPPWPESGRMSLFDPGARFAVFELRAEHVMERGLLVDWCDVAVLGAAGQPPQRGHQPALRLASTIVVWAESLAALAGQRHRETIVCSLDAADAALIAHQERGGRAVVCNDEEVVFHRGTRRLTGFACDRGLTSRAGLVLAAAAAWGLGKEPDAIGNAMPRCTLGAV